MATENPSIPTATTGPRPLPTAIVVAAAASGGAALVHAAAAGTHSGDDALVALFTATAVVQFLAAALLVGWRHRGAAAIAGVVNAVAVGAWLVSRTVGLPLIDALAGVEDIGAQDAIAALLGAVAAGAALVAFLAVPGRTGARQSAARWVPALACVGIVALALPGVASPHAHGADHAHGAEGHGHDDTAGPIVSIDDARLTSAQRDAAETLLDETRAAMVRFPDEASLVAAGYRSIGDGRRAGSFEHFVNVAYMRDGKELDPDAIESIVLEIGAGGTKAVVSGMYILENGSTMDDVPEIAGELTSWHDHQDHCWDPTGTRLAGVVRDGRCFPGGTPRPSAPMLHVWLEDQRCGPFAGIEGHGADSAESCAAHTH